MIVEEGSGFAEVVPQAAHFQDFAGLLLNVAVFFAPNAFEDIADVADDVVGVPFVVYEDTVEGNLDRVGSATAIAPQLAATRFRPPAFLVSRQAADQKVLVQEVAAYRLLPTAHQTDRKQHLIRRQAVHGLE